VYDKSYFLETWWIPVKVVQSTTVQVFPRQYLQKAFLL